MPPKAVAPKVVSLKVAALQYTARDSRRETSEIALRLIEQACDRGADFICLPECANFLATNKASLFAKAETEASSGILAMAQNIAKQRQVTLSLGSLMMRGDDDETDNRIANRHYIIAKDGSITARYDKIHMFDANVNDGKRYRESNSFKPGTKAVMTSIEGHKTGLSICYDVRFAQLYHHYASQQAEIILTPAAFTATTGAAHWHVLQRSRAIETGAFIIAAAQKGTHDDGRQTYGHALIIDPWGRVLDDAGQEGDMAMADLDFAQVTKARASLTAWCNQSADFLK